MSRRKTQRALCLHAASERDADMLYACGMWLTDPAFWFRRGAHSYIVVSPLEVGRAKWQGRARHVIDGYAARGRASRKLGRPATPAETFLLVLQEKEVRAVAVPSSFPVGTADTFRAAGIDVEVRPPMFFPERIRKRDDEVAAIRRAQAAGERALNGALDVLREARTRSGVLRRGGDTVTAELLRSVIHESLVRDDCTASHTIVAVGDQCVDPHDIGSGPVRPNESIIFDIFPRENATGYHSDMTRTVVRGKASRELRDLYDTVYAGQQYAFDRIKAGCDAQAIHQGIRDLFHAEGWPTGEKNGRNQGFFHGTGHGVGLDIHEPPSFGLLPSRLPNGAVVTVEPGLYYEKLGGARLEDMVLVTQDGCENLTPYEKVLEV